MKKNCENITNGFNKSKYEKQRYYTPWSRINTFNGHEFNRVRVQISDNLDNNLDNKNWDSIVKTRSKEEFPLIYSCEDSTSDSSSGNLCDIQCKQSAKGPMENQDIEIEEASTSHPTLSATDGGSNITQPIKFKMDVGINRGIYTVTNIKSAKKIAEDLNEDLDEGMRKSKKVESEKESSAASLPGTSFSQSLPSPKLKYKELSHLTNEEESRSRPTSSTAIPFATFVQNSRCPKSKPEKFTKPDMSTIKKNFMNPSPYTANGGSVSSNVTNGKNYDSDYHEIKEPTRERTSPNILAQSLPSTSKAGNNLVILNKAYARQRQFSAVNKGSKMHVEESKGSLDSNQKNNISSDRKDNISSDRRDNISSDRRDNISSDRRDNVSSDRRDNIRSNRRDNIRSFSSNYLSKMSCCKRLMFLPLTVIVVFSIAVYMSESQDRKHSSDFASAVVELKRIHGQDALISDLSEYLLSDTPRLKIITLIGGTGVGKSYTVEIIKKNFPRKYSIRQYFPPIRTGFEFNIPFLQPGLIIIENLKERDLMDVAKFFKRYQDTYKDKLVTVLAVFNFDVSSYPSIRKIENIFINEDIISKDIRFFYYLPLDENALSMCIMDAMMETGLTLSENKFATVKRSLIQNNAGCKGAYNKVQIYGRQ
ncbi:uncharacterized protein [Temnothorax nylanderi]|uniref:uncharacterized protein n=1 Tax=Temnothorax nylanderi TaxID=102681 RepID=UPI003A8AA798